MRTGDWAGYLESVSRPVLAGTPLAQADVNQEDALAFLDGFTDERGHRRAVDRPLLTWMLRRSLGAGPVPEPGPGPVGLDLALWWALATGRGVGGLVEEGEGPLVGLGAFESGAIEATTETELGALHALWHHGRDDDAARSRCLAAARWHVENLQPDNGTNHPWAVAVFVGLAAEDGRIGAGASLHAQTLVHNALVASGRPDRFSACLLLDAARSLRAGGGD